MNLSCFRLFYGKIVPNCQRFLFPCLISHLNYKSNIILNDVYKRNIHLHNRLWQKRVENENHDALGIILPNLIIKQIPVSNSSYFYEQFLNCPPGHLEDPKYNSMVDGLVQEIHKMDFDQMFNVLNALSTWDLGDKSFAKNFSKIWTLIDDRLTSHIQGINLQDNQILSRLLAFAVLYYKIGISRINKYNKALLEKAASSKLSLDKENLLFLAFMFNIQRSVEYYLIEPIMLNFISLIDQMSIDEIAVVCLALFKTKYKIPMEIMDKIISRFNDELSNLSNFTMGSLCKALRFSLNRNYTNQIDQILQKATSNLSKFNQPVKVHVTLLADQYEVYNPQLFDYMINDLCNNITAYRLKDIDRILHCFSTFNHKVDTNKLQFISDYLHDNDQLENYPICSIASLLYMSILEFYPEKLIRKCFQPKFLSKLESKNFNSMHFIYYLID